jgi:hypothetical protein
MMIQTFTAAQIATLRAEFAAITTVNPDRLDAFHAIFDGCSNAALAQLAAAQIKFVSKLAVNAISHREGAIMAFGQSQIVRLMAEGQLQ